MSYQKVKLIRVAPNAVRDWFYIHEGTADHIVDVYREFRAVGLDWHLWNRGAASITVTLEGTYAITIPANTDRGFDNVKFSLISIAATDSFTLVLTGVERLAD